MLDLLRHPRVPSFARAAVVVVLGVTTFTAVAQYRQSSSIIDDITLTNLALVMPGPVEELLSIELELPDFESYESVEGRKEAFFEFMSPYVMAENSRIASVRAQLLPMAEVVERGLPLSDVEAQRLAKIAADYRIDLEAIGLAEGLAELVRRVDTIPISLALAQAANESAWGMSRFAREGNNIFGQWCFDEGCGLVPEQRHRDATHEVRAFSSVEASVSAYFRNLNTHESYADMRGLRSDMRAQARPLDALVLARGLLRYSERGVSYVNELQDIIRVNRLAALDRS